MKKKMEKIKVVVYLTELMDVIALLRIGENVAAKNKLREVANNENRRIVM